MAGTLDGVLAAFVLDRYHGERRTEIVRCVEAAADAPEFSRERTAILGVGMERRWTATTEARARRFIEHFARLEAQAGHPESDPTSSPRLLWLCSRAALVDVVRAHDATVADRLRALLDGVRTSAPSLRDRLVAAAALGDLVPADRSALAERATRDVLGRVDAGLTSEDAIAAGWFTSVLLSAWAPSEPAPPALRALMPELDRRTLEHTDSDDILTALLADGYSVARAATSAPPADVRGFILTAFDTFTEVARRLHQRRQGHPPFVVDDEYDVQDLVYAMLKVPIPDLIDEEPTPKQAGTAKHIDFVTVTGKAGIEAKFVRDPRHGREVADEIRQDIDHYPAHAHCDSVYVFVFDPQHHVRDAGSFERDLSGPRVIKGKEVVVEVRVRPR